MPPPGLAPGLPPEEDERHPPAAAAPATAAGMRTEPPGSNSSEGYDPWARQDPWNRTGAMAEPANADYIQLLQWRQANAPPRPPTPGANRPELVHLHSMGGTHQIDPLATPMAQWGYAARDEAERTTAGPPPEWDGVEMEFKDYKIKAKLWLRTTRTPAVARGPLLLKGLTGTPWEHMKFLATDDRWLDDPTNGNFLLALMDTKEYYGEEERESMLAACSRLTFHLRRSKGERAQGFMLRWDDSARKVREKGVILPDDYLGFLLVNALQLTSEQIKLLLNYTRGSLKVSEVKAWLRVHETDLDMSTLANEKKKSTSEVHALDNDPQGLLPDQDYNPDDEEVPEEGAEILLNALAEMSGEDDEEALTEITESEAKEVLMTMIRDKPKNRTFQGAMKAKKNRDLARGFGAGRDGGLRPGTYKVSIEELKKRTKCHKCSELGHRSRECPNEARFKNDGKTKELHHLFSERPDEAEFLYLDSEAAASASSDQQGHSGQPSAQADFVYMSVPVHPCHHMQQVPNVFDDGCATLDTGCQRMAVGMNALERYSHFLPTGLKIQFVAEKHQFRSVHQTSVTTRVAIVPSSLGQRGSFLKPAIFEEEHCRTAPFLISLPFLLHCGAQLVLDERAGLSLVSDKLKFSARCHLGPTGALRVFLQDFNSNKIRHLQQSASYNRPEYEILRTEHSAGSKLHQVFGNDSSAPESHDATPEEEPNGGECVDHLRLVPPGLETLHDDRAGDSKPRHNPDEDPRTARHEGSEHRRVGRTAGNRRAGRSGLAVGGTTPESRGDSLSATSILSNGGGELRDGDSIRVDTGQLPRASSRSDLMADSAGVGPSNRSTKQALHLHDQEELPAALLALPKETRGTMSVLPVVGHQPRDGEVRSGTTRWRSFATCSRNNVLTARPRSREATGSATK